VTVNITLALIEIVSHRYGTEQACWLDNREGLEWAFLGPVAVVLIINLTLLVLVMRNILAAKVKDHGNETLQRVRRG
jgi:hypothetical protein